MVADMRFPPFFVHARPVGSIHRPGACARLARAGEHHAKSLGRIEAGERQPSRRRRHGHGHDPQPGQMAAPNDGLAPDPAREVLRLAHRLEHGDGHGGRSDGWPPPEHHSPAPTRLFPRKREGDHFSSFFSNPTRPKRAVCGRARRAALFARRSWRAPQRSPLVESPRRRPRATPRRPTDALSLPTPQHPGAPPFISSSHGPKPGSRNATPAGDHDHSDAPASATPAGAHDPPPGSAGNADGARPKGATATGTPASTAAATDAQDPDPHEGKGPGPNRAEGRDEAAHTSTPRRAESQRTSARERRARRATRGRASPPPASQRREAGAGERPDGERDHAGGSERRGGKRRRIRADGAAGGKSCAATQDGGGSGGHPGAAGRGQRPGTTKPDSREGKPDKGHGTPPRRGR